MLNYSTQQPVVLFNEATLTTAFSGNRKELPVSGFSKLSLDVSYTGTSTLQFSIEHSTDGTNWYSLVIDNTSTVSEISPRVWEIDATSKLNILIDIAYKNLRISMKEAVAGGTATIVATLSGL